MIFVSAQPDIPYFHWQVEVMILDFLRAGVHPNSIEVLFSCAGARESPAGRDLANAYPFVRFFFYPNTLTNDFGYIPMLRPHVLKKHFARFPDLAKQPIFYHDSDILFQSLPDFPRLCRDDVCHLSDTVSYIGADYLQSKGDDLLARMGEIIGLDPAVAIANQACSGGAQYLLKGIDADFWAKVERDSGALFAFFKEREERERAALSPEQLAAYNPVQKWCSDMWAVLWNLWLRGKTTRVAPELSFSWAVSPSEEWPRHPIYHNAGITEASRHTHFFKGDYIERDPFGADLDYVHPGSCSWHYAQAIVRASHERRHYRRLAA